MTYKTLYTSLYEHGLKDCCNLVLSSEKIWLTFCELHHLYSLYHFHTTACSFKLAEKIGQREVPCVTSQKYVYYTSFFRGFLSQLSSRTSLLDLFSWRHTWHFSYLFLRFFIHYLCDIVVLSTWFLECWFLGRLYIW